MGFLAIWPLGLLVLAAGIILLYILKQEAKPQTFSSVMLWREALKHNEATSPWERLKKHLLMFLQLLAVLLFVLAMMNPWLAAGSSSQAVLVIDNSASMAALYDEEVTRLEAAKEAACSYVDSLPSDCVLHVITGNRQAALLVSNSSDKALVKERIRQILQTGLAGDPSVTLGLVSSCASQSEDAEIVFYTDTAFDLGDMEASVASFYSDADNLSVDQVSFARRDDQLQVMARVNAYGSSQQSGEVDLYGQTADGQEILLDIAAFEVSPGESAAVYFELEQSQYEGLTGLKAELDGQDALDGDNRAWCVLEDNQIGRVLLLSDSNLFVEKALGNLAGVDLYRSADPGVITADSDYDLYIFDGMVPDELPANGNFLFIHCDGEGMFTHTDEVTGVRLRLLESEVTAYVADAEAGVNEAYVYEVPSWGTSYIDGGTYSAGFYGIYDSHRIAVLGFDLHQTDFGLQTEFPVLMSNLSEYLLGSHLTEESSYTAGDSVILYGSTRGSELSLQHPDGSVETMEAEEAYGVYWQVTDPGIYRLSQTVDGVENVSYISVNFPYSGESEVTPAQTMTEEEGQAQTADNPASELSLRHLLLILLLILLAAEWILYGRSAIRKRWSSRWWGETLVRGLVLLLVVLALSGISIRKSSPMTTTVFVMDMSDSTKSAWQDETAFVRSAIQAMPDDNQAGIVVFGADTQIEQFVSSRKAFTEVQSAVLGSATNLEQAVQTALALFPEETAKRLVLLTDGAENEGSLADLAVAFAGTDIELKVVRYDGTMASEVYVSDVALPDTIAEGSQFQVEVSVEASEATHAVVSLYSGKTLKGQQEVDLQQGSNQLVFADQGVESGIKRYRVTVEAEQDTVTINNTYSAYTTVTAKPRLLLVEGSRDESSAFVGLLDAGGYDYDVVLPSGVPGNVADMLAYQSVILLDVYADDLRSGFMDTLESYVKDYAGGLICIGGSNSYALGNYRNTPLETVLPVKMDLEGEKEVPSIAMVMVIDHSGSMSSPSTQRGNISCMDVAKQAAANALDSLREVDEVGVLAFDDSYTWAVPIQKAQDIEGITEKIGGIAANGGTNIYPALEEAIRAIKTSDAALKHIVLLTDGQDGYHAYEPLLEEMAEEGITLSTVAVGTGADTGMLEELAQSGQGRYYYSDAGTSLPRIFAQEVYLSAKSYLINEEFTPVIVNSHEILQNIFSEGSPSLLGYVATTAKPTATTILESPREDPLLVVWQYGLGRTVAWTSDGTNEWTGHFAGWDGYAALWKNIIDWTIADTSMGEDTLTVEQQSTGAVITYQTENYTGDTQITAVLTDEDGNQQEVTLRASAPGVYEGEAALAETGVYSINVRNQNGTELVKSVNTAMAMQYSKEYRYADVSNSLDNFTTQVSGRYITEPDEVFDTILDRVVTRTELTIWLLLAAILLFFLDVVQRRLHLDWMGALGQKLGTLRRPGRMHKSGGSGSAGASGDGGGSGSAGASGNGGTASSSAGVSGDGGGLSGTPDVGQKSGQKNAHADRSRARRQNAAVKVKKTGEDPGVIDTAALLKKKKDRDL